VPVLDNKGNTEGKEGLPYAERCDEGETCQWEWGSCSIKVVMYTPYALLYSIHGHFQITVVKFSATRDD